MIQERPWHKVFEPDLALLDLLLGEGQLKAGTVFVTFMTAAVKILNSDATHQFYCGH